MKAEELRIGSWVFYDNSLYRKGIYKVWSINNKSTPIKQSITFDLDSEQLDRHVSHAYIVNIHPVLLTEEILLKCGFRKQLNGNVHLSIDTRSINSIELVYNFKDKLFTMWTGSDITHARPVVLEVQYLHQLQNLFYALTNKELEVKL